MILTLIWLSLYYQFVILKISPLIDCYVLTSGRLVFNDEKETLLG
jgi:hypothetical protein